MLCFASPWISLTEKNTGPKWCKRKWGREWYKEMAKREVGSGEKNRKKETKERNTWGVKEREREKTLKILAFDLSSENWKERPAASLHLHAQRELESRNEREGKRTCSKLPLRVRVSVREKDADGERERERGVEWDLRYFGKKNVLATAIHLKSTQAVTWSMTKKSMCTHLHNLTFTCKEL